MTESLAVTVPNDRRFFGVVRMLVGGLAARLDLPYEQMDDLQLAVESVLLADLPPGAQVTLTLSVREDAIGLEIGPLEPETLEVDLASTDGIGLGRLLSILVDRVEVVERSGEEWLELEKSVLSSRPS